MSDTARPRRSALYMPASNPRALAKARSLPADVIILDLEDAVAPEAKEDARAAAIATAAEGGFGHRELVIRIRQSSPRWVTFSVVDRGPGVPADVAKRLFTPFFTTRREGMGLGLSVCRTVIEQHGGALVFAAVAAADGDAATEFRFTLPVEGAARRSGGAPAGSREPAPLRSPP